MASILFAAVILCMLEASSMAFQSSRGNLVMRERKCDITGTRQNSKAMSVSKSNVHTHRVQHVNLQTKKLWWEEGNKMVKLRVSTRTLKTIAKKGLGKLAKEYNVDLNKFAVSAGSAPVKVAAVSV